MARVRIAALSVSIAAVVLLAACSGGSSSSTPTPKAGTSSPAATIAALGGSSSSSNTPKVPFGNDPCQALSTADETTVGLPTSPAPTPDKAPANLPINNVCFYPDMNVGFQAKIDYDSNNSGNRNTSQAGPSDLPDAFYDKQGGLWFAKNGYYVVVAGRSSQVQKAAEIIAAKL